MTKLIGDKDFFRTHRWVKDEMGSEFIIEHDKFNEFVKVQEDKDKVTDVDERAEERTKSRTKSRKLVTEADERADERVTLQKFADNYNQNQARESVSYYKVNDVSLRDVLPRLASPLTALAILGVSVLALAYFLSFISCY